MVERIWDNGLQSNLMDAAQSEINEVYINNMNKIEYHRLTEERHWRVEVGEKLLLEREQEGIDDSYLEVLE